MKRINEKYNDIIHYELSEASYIELKDRAALYLASDFYISTGNFYRYFLVIREGVNLMPLEYIYLRQNNPGKSNVKIGVVLLSEFSTSSCILNGILRINPWTIEEVNISF